MGGDLGVERPVVHTATGVDDRVPGAELPVGGSDRGVTGTTTWPSAVTSGGLQP